MKFFYSCEQANTGPRMASREVWKNDEEKQGWNSLKGENPPVDRRSGTESLQLE